MRKLPFPEALKAAAAYRRAHMTWREIGKQLGYDKDRLRAALTEQGIADGWGESSIKSVSSGFATMSQRVQSK